MAIIQLDQYFQVAIQADFAFGFNDISWVCAQLPGLYDSIVRGETVENIRVDLSNIILNDVTVDVPETNLANNLSLFVNETNRFENRGYVSNESYLTPVVSETVKNSVRTSNTTGYKFTEKISTSSKFKAKIPLTEIGAEYSVGFELGFEQNLVIVSALVVVSTLVIVSALVVVSTLVIVSILVVVSTLVI
ncbi:hypothetical protein M3Y14_30510 [Bacillus thuringiensis]|uniref:hypothetical protein n=1 Tax=Bacillus thuringiensis TaxID=1428 RepID=UPI00222469D6|nr:hypothetical protein [Bacillus thuringiensis]UYX52601.1 hypothetical protein M3Y14_30510 [Bacillus thuringiensis]